MTHKTGPEQAVSVNEGKAVTVGVSLLNKCEGTPDKQLIGSIEPFEHALGWAVRCGGPWCCSEGWGSAGCHLRGRAVPVTVGLHHQVLSS